MKSPRRMKQSYTTAPKKAMGKKKTAGHDMGNSFMGGNPKKMIPDQPPRTRNGERSARRMRLANKFI